MVRAPCYDEFGMKKGAWSVDEDNKLRTYIQRHGHLNWSELPKFAGLSRSGKSCRLRWMNYLRPNVKHGNFTKEEEDVIVDLHNKFGNKWSMMATRLPGRSDNEIKNHWHTHLKNRIQKDETDQVRIKKVEKLEPSKAYTEISSMKISSLKIQDEVDILLAVLSSESTSCSLTTEVSSCSLSSSDSNIVVSNDVTPQFSNLAGSFWSEPFQVDNESIISSSSSSSSSDVIFSPLGSTNNLMSHDSFLDNIMDDVFLWSTLDPYYQFS